MTSLLPMKHQEERNSIANSTVRFARNNILISLPEICVSQLTFSSTEHTMLNLDSNALYLVILAGSFGGNIGFRSGDSESQK